MNWYKKIKVAQHIRLWLDDERNPQDPFIQQNFWAKGDEVWVKTVPEAIKLIDTGNVAHISFDHDLGEGLQSGHDLAKYIEEKAFNNEINRIEWSVHSQNPSGANNIANTMNSADRFWKRNQELNKKASLQVKILSADNNGNLSISINGKQYNYELPYSAIETASDIQKARGKKLSNWVKWLDQYLPKEDKGDQEEQMVLPFPR